MHDGKAEKIRLTGIDYPEKHQAFGRAAKRFVSDAVFGQKVKVQTHGQDKYRRTLGEVFTQDGNSLNRGLLKVGLAWWFFKYSDDTTLGQLEVAAKVALWEEGDQIPLWVFRQMLRVPHSKSSTLQPATLDGPILGNRRSRKCHRPDSRNYGDISDKNKVPFEMTT